MVINTSASSVVLELSYFHVQSSNKIWFSKKHFVNTRKHWHTSRPKTTEPDSETMYARVCFILNICIYCNLIMRNEGFIVFIGYVLTRILYLSLITHKLWGGHTTVLQSNSKHWEHQRTNRVNATSVNSNFQNMKPQFVTKVCLGILAGQGFVWNNLLKMIKKQ